VFWNNEIVNTLRLDRAGLLARYDPPAAANFPAEFQSTDHRWHGFAARARVLLVNTEKLVAEEFPQSILDLADPRWKGHCAIAKPLAGTTASHAACLFAAWGAERAEEFFRGVKANCQVLSGNKQVARAVATGEVAFGLTDTDDAMGEIDAGRPVAIVYPDQGPEQMGALFIPNTVSLVANHPHAEAARRLVDFLLSPVVEQRLAAGPSVQIPLSSLVPCKSTSRPRRKVGTTRQSSCATSSPRRSKLRSLPKTI
jgi:iron(III) transport system substrate-binding protein